MDRRQRKQMKQDAFVEHTRSLVERFEENPRPWVIGAIAVVAVSLIGLGTWRFVESRREHAADRLARAQAALLAPIVTDETPNPDDPYRPTFSSAEERAARALERLAEAESGSTRALVRFLEGTTALEAGRVEEAIAALEQARDALGDDPTLGGPVEAALATAYGEADRLDEAIDLWTRLADEEADKAYPGDLALAGLARALDKAGRSEEARERWQAIVDLYPSSPAAAEARRALDRLTGAPA